MPRQKSGNDKQVAIRLPKDILDRADALIPHVAPAGVSPTRADVLRAAMVRGIELFERERHQALCRAMYADDPCPEGDGKEPCIYSPAMMNCERCGRLAP